MQSYDVTVAGLAKCLQGRHCVWLVGETCDCTRQVIDKQLVIKYSFVFTDMAKSMSYF